MLSCMPLVIMVFGWLVQGGTQCNILKLSDVFAKASSDTTMQRIGLTIIRDPFCFVLAFSRMILN